MQLLAGGRNEAWLVTEAILSEIEVSWDYLYTFMCVLAARCLADC